MRGRNQDIARLKASCFDWDEVWVVKPSCNFHFWCLQTTKKNDFGGYIKKFLKNLRKIFLFIKIEAIIFENPIFAKKIENNCTFSSKN